MAFDRPTLSALVDRVQADFVSRLGGSGAPLRRSVIAVFSRVLAGAVHMLHGHVEYLARQLFPDLADDAFLVRYASLYGITKAPATYATGSVSVTGEIGAEVPNGAILRRSDGVEYRVNADFTLGGAGVDVTVVAVLAAETGNADAGVELTFESPILDVDAAALVATGGLVGGSDEEGTESLRTRLLARLRSAPQGGAESDYTLWALAVPGVTRVWVYPSGLGAGTVVVYFVRDNDGGSIIPSGGEVTEVQDYVDVLRPVTAAVTVAAPTAKTWAFTIELIPDTAAGRTAVAAEIADFFATDGAPGADLPVEDARTAVGQGAKSVGATYHLTVPSANLTHAAGELPILGTITWV